MKVNVTPKRSFKSSYERKYYARGISSLELVTGGKVVFTGYEWVTFNVGGTRYTPDFCHIMDDGRMVFVEVKGSRRQANYRDARRALRIAASLNTWFDFYEVRPAGDGEWSIERIEPGEFLVREDI